MIEHEGPHKTTSMVRDCGYDDNNGSSGFFDMLVTFSDSQALEGGVSRECPHFGAKTAKIKIEKDSEGKLTVARCTEIRCKYLQH